MRIACVHVPQFALQSLTRIDPSLRGAPVAVVGAGFNLKSMAAATRTSAALHSPVVQACSRAAWALGIRLGMTAMAAHALAPGQLRVVSAETPLERETVRAIADSLLTVSAIVDTGGRVGSGGASAHWAIYCQVPSKTRGTSFGDRLLEVLDALGLSARIGIADDRFTAWVAAAHGGSEERGVVSVPRGGSAAFLSARPLSLLAITPEVQHMLEALGVRTLGEFAALPAPSVSRPMEADYQALARGDSGHLLRPYTPEAPVREQAVISTAAGPTTAGSHGLGISAAVALLAERVGLRLAGRGRGAARIELTISGTSGERVVAIDPLMAPMGQLGRPSGGVLESAEDLAEAFGRAVTDSAGAARLAWNIHQTSRSIDSGKGLEADRGARPRSHPGSRELVLSVRAEREPAVRPAMPEPRRSQPTAGEFSRLSVTVTGEAIAGDPVVAAAQSDAARGGPMVDALAVVLSTTGSQAGLGSWQLSLAGPSSAISGAFALRTERRDAHRRTRRSKQLRRRTAPLAQPSLFVDRK